VITAVILTAGCPQGTQVNEALRAELIRMDEHDQAVRIAAFGWPTERLVGADGARAAHRIAQHSINHPAFMRECRRLLDEASARGEVPRSHFAYIDDRIRVYEGLPQRYGTQ
jgi:hypothetical protein